jgi:predicted transcriptional regulator
MTHPQSTFSKRGRLAILYEMLTLCQTEPIMKTHLMYRANLSHRTLTKFLSLLLNLGLCTEERHNDTTECECSNSYR